MIRSRAGPVPLSQAIQSKTNRSGSQRLRGLAGATSMARTVAVTIARRWESFIFSHHSRMSS